MSIKVMGTLCILGGAVKLIPAILSGLLPASSEVAALAVYSGAIAFPLLLSGPFALWKLTATGTGWTARIGAAGTVLALFGLSVYIIGMSFNIIAPSMLPALLPPVAAISTGTGMLILGIAVAAARRLPGWRLYAPLAVGAAYFLQIVFQALLRFSQGETTPFSVLLGIWWLAWLVLGYTLVTLDKNTFFVPQHA